MQMCVSAPHLASLHHIDLFFIHGVLVLRQEAVTLVFHLPKKHNTVRKKTATINVRTLRFFKVIHFHADITVFLLSLAFCVFYSTHIAAGLK